MSDRVELKHLEMENQKYQFRYLRNQLNEKKLYRGDPRLLMYVYFHDGRSRRKSPKDFVSNRRVSLSCSSGWSRPVL